MPTVMTPQAALTTTGSTPATGIATLSKPFVDTTCLFELYGDYTGLSFVFEGAMNGTNFGALSAVDLSNDKTVTGTLSPADATVQQWRLNCTGLGQVRARITAISANTAKFDALSLSVVGAPTLTINQTGQTISGVTTFGAGLTFNGATGTNTLTVSDNLASALNVASTDSKAYITVCTTDASEAVQIGQNVTLADAVNITANATTGTKIGTATTQKLGLWNVTPVVQPSNATDIYTALVNVGVIATGGTPGFSPPGTVTIADAKNIVLNTTTGTQIGTGATQKLAFYGATPVVQAANSVDYVTMLTNLGLRATGGTAAATFPGVVNGVGMVNTGVETNSVGGSTAAAGTTFADATGLPAGTSAIYPTTAADDTKGVIIDVADKVTGRTLFIGNGVSNKILKVYGPSGAVINGAGANAAFSSASGKGVTIVCLSGAGNTWLAA